MFSEVPVLFSVVAYPLVPLITAFVILRRRNRTAPGDRASGVIYLTQAVGATTAAWSLLLAVLSVPVIFGRQSAIDASADVMPFSPWPLPDPQAVDDASPHIMFADFDQVRLGADNGGLELPTPVWPTGLDLWPLWGALALGVLAVLIRHGIRLQRDTEGLV